MVELAVHLVQLLVGVWLVCLFCALVRCGMEIRELRRMMSAASQAHERRLSAARGQLRDSPPSPPASASTHPPGSRSDAARTSENGATSRTRLS